MTGAEDTTDQIEFDELLSSISIERVDLIFSGFSNTAVFVEADDDAPKKYSCVIDFLLHKKESLAFGVDCSVERVEGDEKTFDATASYMTVVENLPADLNDNTVAELAKQLAVLNVWPRFEAYFNLLNHQSGATMPPLPLVPSASIDIQKEEAGKS